MAHLNPTFGSKSDSGSGSRGANKDNHQFNPGNHSGSGDGNIFKQRGLPQPYKSFLIRCEKGDNETIKYIEQHRYDPAATKKLADIGHDFNKVEYYCAKRLPNAVPSAINKDKGADLEIWRARRREDSIESNSASTSKSVK